MLLTRSPYWRAVGAIIGALTLAGSWWSYKLGITIASQAGVIRTLGVFEVLALGVGAIAALSAPALRALVAGRQGTAAFLLFGLALLNAALTGLSIFFLTPRFAPQPILGLVIVAMGLLMARFMRYDATTQVFVGRSLTHVGLALWLVLFLPLPWVLAAYATDEPHLALSALPPKDVALRVDAPRHIVLVSFDALRERSTTLGDPKLDTTPHLGALARESYTYTNTRAASDNTLVSLPTVLTGVRPNDYFPHIGNNSIYLREGFLTGLGGFLAPGGYRSYYATMLVNPLIFGLDGEFSAGHMTSGMFRRNQFNTRHFLPLSATWDWTREKLAGHWDDNVDNTQDELPATREAFNEGLAYLQAAGAQRTFVWIHVAVPHTPYHDVPKDAVDAPGLPSLYPYVTEREVAAANGAMLQHYEHVYEDYVRFGDAELGHFLAGLKAAKLYDDAMIIVTADHGEEFGQPGHIPHGNGIATEDVTHVPLVIHTPGQHEGQRVDALVGHRDIVPTVLARVYQHVPQGLVGLPLLDGPVPTNRVVYTWAMSAKYIPALHQAQSIAAYSGTYKLLVRYPTHEESLYDLSQDPKAETNLASRRPDVVARLLMELQADMHLNGR